MKLDYEKAEEIRELYRSEGLIYDVIAERYGISIGMVSMIVNNKSWIKPRGIPWSEREKEWRKERYRENRDTILEKHREYYRLNKESFGKRSKERHDRGRRFILDYLLEHPCVDCGEPDPVCLDFHHLRDKMQMVSQMKGHTLEKLKDEMDKCEVVCANCHRRRHVDQRVSNDALAQL